MSDNSMPNMSGTVYGYKIEEKSSGEWKVCSFSERKDNEPREPYISFRFETDPILKQMHMLSYRKALALGWWLRANGHTKIRIVEYKIKFKIDCYLQEDSTIRLVYPDDQYCMKTHKEKTL